jgi:aminoglycoside phosphotransferase (APT) family kinase protein
VEPGRLIGSGRDAEIFDFGPGRVLRKARDGRSLEDEARVMAFVADHGYPAPAILDVRADGAEIVMERIDGPLMADVMAKQPWKIPRLSSQLADLHDQLHEIVAPEWLRPWDDDGDRVLHLDLHPLNVLMAPRGAVVIDWANAARGDGLSDVALTYVLVACATAPGSRVKQIALQAPRVAVARLFTRRYRGRDLDDRIAVAAEMKTLDPNMSPDEIDSLRALAHRFSAR